MRVTSSLHVAHLEALRELVDIGVVILVEHDHVSPDDHRFARADINLTVVIKTVTARVRHSVFVVHDDEACMSIATVDAQARRGGPGQTHVGVEATANFDENVIVNVETGDFFPVDEDVEHIGLDLNIHTTALIYVTPENTELVACSVYGTWSEEWGGSACEFQLHTTYAFLFDRMPP